MVYVVSFSVFTSIIMTLVLFLLLLEARVVPRGKASLVINDDPDKAVEAPLGTTLLSALSAAGIYLPSACGGGGSCGQCRCRVEEGGGDIQPTELSHLSRQEKKDQIRLAYQLKVRQDMRLRLPEYVLSIKKYSATVVSNHNVATFIKELVVELDKGETLDFKAGQYMQIDIPEYELCFNSFDVADRYLAAWEKFNFLDLCVATDEPVFRAYSLANPPYEEKLRFTVRIATPPPGREDLPPGVGSSYVFDLKPGDRITLSGPYGDFLVDEDSRREMCFVGGGAGMAPMRSHILHQLNGLGTSRRITFWYGARSRQEMFYDEEFRDLAERFDNFSYYVALSEPETEDNWTGLTGFIHECLYEEYLKDHDDPAEIEYYLCGPPPMIAALEKMLDDLGVDRDMIAYDEF